MRSGATRTATLPDATPDRRPSTGPGSNLFGLLVTAVAVGLLLFLIGWAAPVIAPFGLGLFLTALATPLFGWLIGRGSSPVVAMVLTVIMVVVVAGALALLAIVSTRTLTESLDDYSGALAARYPDLAATLDSVGMPTSITEWLSPETLTAILRGTIRLVIDVGAQVAFAVVLAALLLLDSPRLRRLESEGLGDRNAVLREAPAIARAAVTYFRVRIRINAVTALGLLAVSLLVGVDHALLWAVGAFFLSFVPYLGLILALIPPTILAFAESGLVAAAIVVIGGAGLNVLAENVLEPTLTGRALKLSTWFVFAMFFLWVWILGPLGALLAMPITVLVVLVLRRNEPTRWLADLLSRDPEERAVIPS